MSSVFEQQIRTQAVSDFECPSCGAGKHRPCRVMSTEWTGKRPLWKRASLHQERLDLAYRRALAAMKATAA